nr:PAS domain-containing protein [uncultured Rhodopila sp.]
MNSLLARLLVVVAIAVIPALAFQAYLEIEARQVRQQLLEEEAMRLVRLVAAQQQGVIEGADQMLAALGAAPSAEDNPQALCQRYLSRLEDQIPRYRAVAVIGLDGHPLCAPRPINPNVDLSGQAYFQTALATGGLVLGAYTLGPLSGKPVLPIGRPFRGGDGAVAGVVMAELNLDWLAQQLAAVPLPPGATVNVSDGTGTILGRHPDSARFVGTKLPQRNFPIFERTSPGLASFVAVDGHFRIVAFIPPAIGPGGLYVSVGLDPKTTLSPNQRANRIGIILIAAGAVLALLLTALLGTRLIRRPVRRLLRSADAWRAGDLSARIGLRHDRSEFGRLSAAFEAMADALQAREQALRNALESTTDAVIVMDHDWRISYLNPQARTKFGQGRDLAGLAVWSAIPGSSSGAFGEACCEAARTGAPAHADARDDSLGGHWEVHAYPSADGVTVFSRDVSEQRRITAALQASEERLRLAVEAARLGVRDLDLTTGTMVWTPEAEKLFGRDYVGAATFESLLARIHPDDRVAVRGNWDRVLADPGSSFEHEYRFQRDDGSWRWIAGYGRTTDEAGRATRLIAIVQDITGRKQTEAELLQATALLRAIGNSSAESLYARDSEGRFLYANPAELAVIGKPLGEVIGRSVAEVHANAEQAAVVMANDRRIQQTGRTEIIEEDYDAAGLGKRVFRSAKSPLRLEDGTVIGIVGVSSDITRLKDAEAELRVFSAGLEHRVREEVAAREAAQMRAAHAERMQALGQLAGGIAHDFNNVLQAVAGAMALIERRPDDQPAIRRLTRLAGEATERGAAITRRLLAFGRRGDLRAEAIDAAVLLPDLREILAHTLGASIDVQVRVESGLQPFVADKSQLETSLINLAANARDAMPRGGTIVLSAACETVSRPTPGHPGGIDPGRYVRLTIEDTGTGMDAATLARATEPFFTTKAVGAGSGLGLSMAKGFAEQSGGGMHIESAPGRGTTVTLWLPKAAEAAAARAAAPRAPAAAAAPADAEAAGRARVLLVDDEDAVREVLALQLEDCGFSVLAAASGVEVLALLAAGETAEILVTDLSMPGMDGLAVIRAVQERLPGLPALLLTGYAGDGAALALGGAVSGAFSLLRKPVTAATLADRLDSLLAGRAEGARSGRFGASLHV